MLVYLMDILINLNDIFLLVLWKYKLNAAYLDISEGRLLMYSIYLTLSAASIEASAISAVFSSREWSDAAAKQAHSDYSLTKRHSFIAFSHLFFSQKSNNMLG